MNLYLISSRADGDEDYVRLRKTDGAEKVSANRLRPVVSLDMEGKVHVYPSVSAVTKALPMTKKEVKAACAGDHETLDGSYLRWATRGQVLSATTFKVMEMIPSYVVSQDQEGRVLAHKSNTSASGRASRPAIFKDIQGKETLYISVKSLIKSIGCSIGMAYKLLNGDPTNRQGMYGCSIRYALIGEVKSCDRFKVTVTEEDTMVKLPKKEVRTLEPKAQDASPQKRLSPPPPPSYPEMLQGSPIENLNDLPYLLADIAILKKEDVAVTLAIKHNGKDLVCSKDLTEEVVNKILLSVLETKKDRAYKITNGLQDMLKDD